MKFEVLTHQFIKNIPEKPVPGTLYVSVEYATVVHSCCCGCGAEVVTPLSPSDWNLAFDGESISLWPSIGNWNLPCRSHYVIRRNKALDADNWSRRDDQNRRKDIHAQDQDPDVQEESIVHPRKHQERSRVISVTFKAWRLALRAFGVARKEK